MGIIPYFAPIVKHKIGVMGKYFSTIKKPHEIIIIFHGEKEAFATLIIHT